MISIEDVPHLSEENQLSRTTITVVLARTYHPQAL
jgi:hypothetical protein